MSSFRKYQSIDENDVKAEVNRIYNNSIEDNDIPIARRLNEKNEDDYENSSVFTPLKNSIRTAYEFSSKLPVTDLYGAPRRGADSNLHWYKLRLFIGLMLTFFTLTITAGLFIFFDTTPSLSADDNMKSTISTYDKINITVSNEYGEFSGAKYEWLTDKYLVEPYKTTSFYINTDNTIDNTLSWKWVHPDEDVLWGSSIEKVFTTPGKYDLYLHGIDTNNEVVINQTIPVIVKYVKRELRSLSSEDRHKFLHAASKIWKYTTVEGQTKYGEKFTGINQFVEEHALASNDIMCDQFHEGSGFFTHHFAITQSFEAALRSIDPSATLPYWDFTIEGQEITDAGEIPSYFLEITPFLNDKWFGSTDENDHVQDSKFAYVKMPKITNESIVEPNSYGYIRSYWNNNNDEYAVRHLFDICGVEATNKRIPNCQTHFDIINSSTLSDFQILSPNDGHGTVHVQLGGMGGDCIETYKNFTDTWSELLDADMTTDEIMSHGYSMDEWEWGTKGARRTMLENMVMGEYFHVYKSLWRSHMCARDGTPNLLVCPDNCDENTPTKDCSCQVEALINGTTDWENVYDCILSGHSQMVFNKIFPEEFIIDMVYMLSSMSPIEGEMLESSSPIDILFWVIHPTLERLLSAKRLNGYVDYGGTPIYRWPVVDGSAETWYSFSYFSLDANENKYLPDAYTCRGHDSSDPALPSSLTWLDGFEEIADTDGDGIITNWEYYLAINPNNEDGLDYVFDHFEWEHCYDKI